ncbi:TetR/AcrR family transcriptional regulator [Saccharopolyspora sp. CA-218241]|uniref:TetR/AcrR family transcriptional regulator n=1 Tax=Saccharopolyspora sp. CA-218241 TaxID=3240027 RepID=UPI003D9745C5
MSSSTWALIPRSGRLAKTVCPSVFLLARVGFTAVMAKRGSYAKSAVRRDEILRHALAVVDEEGYAAASVTRIAEAAGISKTGVLHHFGTRENLLTEVLRLRDELDAVEFERPHPSLSDVEDAYLRVIGRNTRIPGMVELFTRLSVEATNPEHPAHDFFLRREKVIGAGISETVSRVLDERGVTDVDPDVVALIVLAVTDGLQQRWLVDRSVDMTAAVGTLFRIFDAALTRAAPPDDHGADT